MDAVTLSVLTSAFAGIAEEMGTLLVRSAYSSNIKERRDCSAALFDADARMIAQAAHVPVHLGALYESVRVVAEALARSGREHGRSLPPAEGVQPTAARSGREHGRSLPPAEGNREAGAQATGTQAYAGHRRPGGQRPGGR